MRFLILLFLCLSLAARATDNLVYGVPAPCDQLIDREGYALGYKASWKTARWVTYRLTADEVLIQVARRADAFAPDPLIPNGPQLEDYRKSGYARGHLAPAADMKWSAKAMVESFYLSNMVPQDQGNNSGIWNEIENTVRGFACAEGKVFVVTGPITSDPPALSVGRGRVAVPTELWKVVYDETAPEKMIGFIVPNRKVKGKPVDFACSVAEVERRTGLRFFPGLQGRDSLKASFDVTAWNWSKSQRPQVVPASEPVAETGWWLSVNSNKRHNRKCENYRRTHGRPCRRDEGVPCKRCGG